MRNTLYPTIRKVRMLKRPRVNNYEKYICSSHKVRMLKRQKIIIRNTLYPTIQKVLVLKRPRVNNDGKYALSDLSQYTYT